MVLVEQPAWRARSHPRSLAGSGAPAPSSFVKGSAGGSMDHTAAAVTASPSGSCYRDPPERDDLIADHMALATSLARRFANRGETLDDLVQTAMIGLVKAATRYDPIYETQ